MAMNTALGPLLAPCDGSEDNEDGRKLAKSLWVNIWHHFPIGAQVPHIGPRNMNRPWRGDYSP